MRLVPALAVGAEVVNLAVYGRRALERVDLKSETAEEEKSLFNKMAARFDLVWCNVAGGWLGTG